MKKMENKETDFKGRKRFCKWLIVPVILAFLIVIVVGGFFALQWMGKASLLRHSDDEEIEITAPEDVKIEIEEGTVTYQGKKYRRNEDLITILCMGIDKKAIQVESGVTGENGQADTLIVAVLDTVTGGMKLLNVSRDSMVDVELYNVQNEYVETSKIQLCLAYAYGDGKETSCENTIKSVSRLLYGMPIDAYAAIDLAAISVLNDAIGGVEVEVLEDMTSYYPTWVQGTQVHLQGREAERYVRAREFEGADAPIDSNNARMARQKQYLTNFIDKALSATKEDIMIPVTLYKEASAYMITDIDVSEVTYLAKLVMQGGFDAGNIINIPGEVKKGEIYAEYYVDEEALYEIILDVFYNEV